ncbi:hypothetical protein E2C01_090099 [Portunus trituberculatus]|uniref:Uncharacterized protein n=1 Tax=Portunus trituberculatus TaxID=210409 RepID=A0A5B7JP88_PORTR|nr:hypothetical protein [Portunus trituberculatus]
MLGHLIASPHPDTFNPLSGASTQGEGVLRNISISISENNNNNNNNNSNNSCTKQQYDTIVDLHSITSHASCFIKCHYRAHFTATLISLPVTRCLTHRCITTTPGHCAMVSSGHCKVGMSKHSISLSGKWRLFVYKSLCSRCVLVVQLPFTGRLRMCRFCFCFFLCI